MAALVCTVRFAWLIFGLCLTGYFSLFFWQLPFPIATNQPQTVLRIHLSGMWLTFAFSAAIITGWISWLIHALSFRDSKLKRAHQQQQQNERLLSLGISAATLAHQLSTPMNNLFLLQDELKYHPDMPKDCIADLDTMQKQLLLCAESLQKLKASPQIHAEAVDLSLVFVDQLDQWRNLRPNVRLRVDNRLPQGMATHINPLFWSALLNILNNAADAGTNEVELSSMVLAKQMLCINIYNRSGHLSASQLKEAGLTELNSSKPAGMGLGVMLSHATLAHIGGSVTLKNHSEGGVHAQILLPLSWENKAK
jgi:two-component system sensor histidine kinase RegB